MTSKIRILFKLVTDTKSGFLTPVMKEAIEIATIRTKPAFAGFRNTGGIVPGFGIRNFHEFLI
jgi:hypothetical protein